jgi:hypothetical protein
MTTVENDVEVLGYIDVKIVEDAAMKGKPYSHETVAERSAKNKEKH